MNKLYYCLIFISFLSFGQVKKRSLIESLSNDPNSKYYREKIYDSTQLREEGARLIKEVEKEQNHEKKEYLNGLEGNVKLEAQKEAERELEKKKQLEEIKEKQNENFRNVMLNYLLLLIVLFLTHYLFKRFGIYNFIVGKIQSLETLMNLNSKEILVLSIVFGVFVALLLGYSFTNNQYFGLHGKRVYHETNRVIKSFNYVLAIGSFIITAGLSYLVINKIVNNVKQ